MWRQVEREETVEGWKERLMQVKRWRDGNRKWSGGGGGVKSGRRRWEEERGDWRRVERE